MQRCAQSCGRTFENMRSDMNNFSVNIPNTQRREGRRHEITVCSVLLCLCVLFIHAASLFISTGDKGSLAYIPVAALWRMCGFAAQGFIFIAGMRFMLSFKPGRNVASYYLSRFKRIIPLYVIWCVIYYAYDVFAEKASFDISYFLKSLLTGELTRHLYYIPVLLQLTLIAPLSMLLRKRLPASVILPASVLITSIFGDHLTDILNAVFPAAPSFAYSDRVFTSFLIFWSAGCCAGAAYDKFCKLLDEAKGFIISAFLITAALDLGAVYYSFILGRFIWCIKQIQMLYVLSAILFLMTVSRMIVKGRPEAPVFFQKSELGGYFIFLSHILPLDLAQLILDKIGVGVGIGLTVRIAVLGIWFVLSALAYGNRLYIVHAKRKLNR